MPVSLTRPCALGSCLTGTLMPHQLEGLNWLTYNWHCQRSVILADEMGLGKTIQTLAFFSWLHANRGCNTFVVVAPLSTCGNWGAELQKWCPHLNTVVYTGDAKARELLRSYEFSGAEGGRWRGAGKKLPGFTVLIISWQLVFSDARFIRGITWDVMVVDEGHRLKSGNSQLNKVLETLPSRHRVLLTGTPLQNNLQELYNLLQFLEADGFDGGELLSYAALLHTAALLLSRSQSLLARLPWRIC